MPALTSCAMVTQDLKESVKTDAGDFRGGPRASTNERYETDVSAIDP